MTDGPDLTAAVNQLVDDYRLRCLWFLREDYYPETLEQQLRVLKNIEDKRDVAAFKRAAELRKWLLQTSSAKSSNS